MALAEPAEEGIEVLVQAQPLQRNPASPAVARPNKFPPHVAPAAKAFRSPPFPPRLRTGLSGVREVPRGSASS